MKELFPDFDSIEFRKRINSDIAEGKNKSSRMFFIGDRVIENFDWLESKRVSKIIAEFIRKFLDFNKSRNNMFLNGFTLFGSWVNGSARFDSDFDIILFSVYPNDNNRILLMDQFSHEFHLQSLEPSLQFYLNCINKFFNDPRNSDNNYNYRILTAALEGIPFGFDAQSLQAKIIESLSSYQSHDDFEGVWGMISDELDELESGEIYSSKGKYKRSEVYGKYAILTKSAESDFYRPLSFDQFKIRWENRCKVANSFCEREGISFK